MSRALNARISAEIQATVTSPTYLVELGFSTLLRLSTGATVTWNGATWMAADLQVAGITERSGGVLEAELVFGNAENEISAIVLGEGVRERPVTIWLIYGEAPYDPDDAVQLFAGVVDSVPAIGYPTRIQAISRGAGASRTPRVPLALIMGADIAAPGERITWGGETYVLEEMRG